MTAGGNEKPPDQNSAAQLGHYDALLSALPAAVFVCDVDGLITYYNNAVVRIWGRSPQLCDPDNRWTGAAGLHMIEDGRPLDPADSCVANVLRTGKPCAEEVVIERPDGDRITVFAEANPLRDDAGKLTGAICLLTDTTERKVAALTQARLGAIVASSDDAIIGKTLDGTIVSWNEAAVRLFGWTPEEAVGKPITIIIPSERENEEREILAKLTRGERVEHYETVRITKSGELLNVSLTSSPIRDAHGKVVGASKIARDITPRIRNEEHLRILHDELRKADQAKNDFLATLAHELRNPLAPIRSLVYVLEHSDAPMQELPNALTVIDRQLSQMTRLIDDLMDVSRISKGKFALRKETIDLRQAIEAAVETSAPLMATYHHRFTAEMPAEPITLVADATRLTQAIGNLLNNAAKYTNTGGEIALKAWSEGDTAVVTVTDNGVGIPEPMIEHIFDMFVQVDGNTTRGLGGLGVGLHLASRLAEMHGGTLTATSDGPGKGSTFRLALPMHAKTIETKDDSPQLAPTSGAAALRRVLVVDDNQDAADSLVAYLGLLGHTAAAVYDGGSLLREGPAFKPDVVLLDIGLPDMDGYETARRLRSEAWGQTVRLCALTGWGQEEARRRSKAAGFDLHFVKPVDAIALMTALEMAERPE